MKHYEKPQLFMEEFTVSEHIARCGMNHEGADDKEWLGVEAHFYADNCHISYVEPVPGGEEIHIFLKSASCTTKWDDAYHDVACYQGNGDDGALQLFGS